MTPIISHPSATDTLSAPAVPSASALRRHAPAAAILVLFLLLGVLYGISTPVLEASDEIRHYPFVRLLAQGAGLPRQQPGVETLWNQEGSQPPLYYALMAALTARIEVDDLPTMLRLNPHAEVGVPGGSGNRSHILHTEREAFPWRGATLAIHLIRLVSLLFGAGTILCTYRLALALFPNQPPLALGAMALNAFIPMFLFISASVNNDNAVIFFSSLAVLMMVRLVQRGAGTPRLLLLGAVIGLACLSKLGALGLIPLAGLALGLRIFVVEAAPSRESVARRAALWAGACLVVAAPILLVAGWWYVRNWRLYGDPTGLNVMLAIAGTRHVTPGPLQLYNELQGFRMSFWGVLGAFNVLLRPDWVYRLLDGLTAAALIGLIAWSLIRWRKGDFSGWAALAIPAAWIVVEFIGLIRWTMQTAASQGRLMFPAISAICLFLTLGLLGLLPRAWQRVGAAAIAAGMFLLAAVTPFSAIRPAYAASAEWLAGSPPATARPIGFDYGGMVRLLGMEMSSETLTPGEPLDVTLYWEALAPVDRDYSVGLSIFSWNESLAGRDSYPGDGAFPTSSWQPGRVLRDYYHLDVTPDAVGPGPAWVAVGLHDSNTLEGLPVADADGRPVVFPVVAQVEIEQGTASWQPGGTLDANLGDFARLVGYDVSSSVAAPGEAWELSLYWQALEPAATDYTVFVHVVDDEGNIVAQTDVQPTQGFYPTSQWRPGHTLRDTYALTLPEDTSPGEAQVLVGLYDRATGERLPVLDASGQPVGNEVSVTSLLVAPH